MGAQFVASPHLTKSSDASIVDPARLDPRRSAQVCGQCHSFWEFGDPAAERDANAHGLAYRPGDDLRATRFIVQPTKNLDSPAMKAVSALRSQFGERATLRRAEPVGIG